MQPSSQYCFAYILILDIGIEHSAIREATKTMVMNGILQENFDVSLDKPIEQKWMCTPGTKGLSL